MKELLELTQPEELELQKTKYGYTALHVVVVGGNVEVAEAMVKKKSKIDSNTGIQWVGTT